MTRPAHAGARDADRARAASPSAYASRDRRRGDRYQRLPVRAGPRPRPAAERLEEAGFEEGDVERILELVPLATHNQRGRGTLYLGTDARSWARISSTIVERSMSSRSTSSSSARTSCSLSSTRISAPLRRGSVRLMIRAPSTRTAPTRGRDFVQATQVNFETIHATTCSPSGSGRSASFGASSQGRPRAASASCDWLQSGG